MIHQIPLVPAQAGTQFFAPRQTLVSRFRENERRVPAHSALTICSVIFLASPSSIMVLGR
jgi:hypothetical protein